jgi:hypothetical protein
LATNETKEVAAIITNALAATTPGKIESGISSGQISEGKANLPEQVKVASRERVTALLNGFPLYPELPIYH